jgi:hypothetical protein
MIQADQTFIGDTQSYIMLEVETNGFDGDIFIIT